MVARSAGDDPGLVAREAAAALAAFAGDPAALVTACRRLVDRQPTSGPVRWLAARVLCAADPAAEAWQAAELLWHDPTPGLLAGALPDEVRVTVLGWPEQAAVALCRRGDVQALVVDSQGDGRGLVSQLRRSGNDAELVGEGGLGAAVAASGLLLVEVHALGPSGLVGVPGCRAAAAVARTSGVPVWVVAGRGRALPEPLWKALAERVAADPAPWAGPVELAPLGPADLVAGPQGLRPAAEAAADTDCPAAPELLRPGG